MNQQKKKPIRKKCSWLHLCTRALIGAVFLLLTVLIPSVCTHAAQKNADKTDIQTEETNLEDIYINPSYADIYSAADVSRDLAAAGLFAENGQEHAAGSGEVRGETLQSVPTTATLQDAVTWKEAVVLTRKAQVEKQEDIILFVWGQRTREDARQLWLEAQAHTGVPEEGDYLHYDFKGVRLLARYDAATDMTRLEFQAVYYTTRAQEEALTQQIGAVLDSLHLNAYSDYGVVREIYRYICAHVTYDNEHKSDRDYTLKYTAYAALVDGTAVCQGYASLLYRMCLERGIDARVIPGTSGGEGHAWNILCLNGRYYNGDTTWDAGKQQAGWSCFLVSNAHLYGHIRRSSYATDEFNLAYPMGEADYTPSAADLQLYFTDVTNTGAYYYVPVEWASSAGITSGMEDGSFGVGKICTRAQIVTFLYHGWLWRGGEEISEKEASGILAGRFTDIPVDSFWYIPAAWAVKYGITAGTTPDSFSPQAACTRSQMVAFLYQTVLAAGKAGETVVGQKDVTGGAESLETENAPIEEKMSAGENAATFTDISSEAYYYLPACWALDCGITAGTGDGTTFSPGQAVTREQAVTMLYKAMGEK